ncbi:hypothetical protein ACFV7R_27445 [Streptomyces sp. NPDC059866]|uniref:hypothetical protein n=1 Tax=Streptomyces sp. NPDC059866 TaxID=3346978 RepID=UPI00364F2934
MGPVALVFGFAEAESRGGEADPTITMLIGSVILLVKGYSPIETGVAFLPLAAAQAFGSMLIGTRLSGRTRPGLLMSGGYLVTHRILQGPRDGDLTLNPPCKPPSPTPEQGLPHS